MAMLRGIGDATVPDVATPAVYQVPTFSEGVTAWSSPYSAFQQLTGQMMFARFKTEPAYTAGLALPVIALAFLLMGGKGRRF